jgi:hypothetical protein
MDIYVKGEAPDGGTNRMPFEGWVVASGLNPETGEFEFLVSDETNGDIAKRLRRVSAISIHQHRTSLDGQPASVV